MSHLSGFGLYLQATAVEKVITPLPEDPTVPGDLSPVKLREDLNEARRKINELISVLRASKIMFEDDLTP